MLVHLCIMLFSVAGLLAIFFAQPARAATVPVTNTLDSGPGSLRQAILDAAPGDTVVFSQDVFSVPQTIALGSQIVLTQSLTLDGGGAAPAISGSNITRTFQVKATVTVTLTGLRIANGRGGDGGGILNNGALNVASSTLSDNTAAGMGGAIMNFGALNVISSTFTSNSALDGGTISNFGRLIIADSTLSSNGARLGGGGIYNGQGATLTMTNNTFFSNNSSYGGSIYNEYSATLSMTNNILAYTYNSWGDTGCLNLGAAAGSHNLIQDSYYNACGLSNGVDGNLIGVDPKLGPLANNGGSTLTHALLPGSPAINAGDDATCPPVDQRGIHRPVGPHCDIGAYESFYMLRLLQVMRE